MAVEAHVLSSLEHPNIVKMRALAKCSPFDGNFFIVMDRLYDTLEKRLETWRVRHMRTSGMAGRLTDRKGKRKNELYEERIVAAFDLAAAVTYLHDKKVLYRDIKPENVGFDIRGDIKIFDFGLAKELKDTDKNADGTYNLTETTGSPRYMAPEIANSKPYNATCDVYSFAILFWEMLALKLPYEMYTNKSLIEHVYNGRCSRPTINPTWPSAIKVLLQRAWAQDWKERPPMEQVTAMLKTEAARVRDGDDSGLEHMRRRSTHVFRPVDNTCGVLQAARVR
jgi:serine/threonine protein kinase